MNSITTFIIAYEFNTKSIFLYCRHLYDKQIQKISSLNRKYLKEKILAIIIARVI